MGRPRNTGEIPAHKVEIDEDTGCHNWIGGRTTRGYGQMRVAGKTYYVHRLVYARVNGPLAPYEDVHHDCRNPSCVNPAHLRSLSRSAHAQEHSTGPGTQDVFCCNGHVADWRINNQGRRVCRQCRRESQRHK